MSGEGAGTPSEARSATPEPRHGYLGVQRLWQARKAHNTQNGPCGGEEGRCGSGGVSTEMR
jgi:hypothetical protein